MRVIGWEMISSAVLRRTALFFVGELPLDSGFLKLTEEATFHNSQNKRGVTWAVLEDVNASEAQGVKIAVFNTHCIQFQEIRKRYFISIRKYMYHITNRIPSISNR